MSHASLIVALSPEDLEKVGGNVEMAVGYQTGHAEALALVKKYVASKN
jgi:hypothetical protein